MAKVKKRKKSYTTEKVIDSLNQTAHKAENFFERHSKIIITVLVVFAVLAIGYFLYLKWVLEPRSEKAFIEMVQADDYFQQDSSLLALKGSPGSFLGYEQIISDYGNTKAGNLARYKAAIAYYRLGDYASAVQNLEKFKTGDDILNAQRNGMIGNALVQSGKLEEGLPYYEKAAKETDIELLQKYYYTKAGKLAFKLEKNEAALRYFKSISDKYADPGPEVEKYVERLTYLTGGN